MFVAKAHSFTQQARLAVTLAWVAGYTNILKVLTCDTVISHVSGTTSNLGRDVAEGRWSVAAFSLFLLATFLVGAVLSGAVTEVGRRRGWESIYVLPMVIEAGLLALFALGVEWLGTRTGAAGSERYLLTGLASAAMGLQNATITSISGGAVRTTHVTGVLTDLGLELIQAAAWARDERRAGAVWWAIVLRGWSQPVPRRVALLASILATFAAGAGLGALAHEVAARWAMFPPVMFLLWIVYQDAVRPIAEIEAMQVERDQMGLPAEVGVYHLIKDTSKPTGAQRMPNLTAWLDRLPRGVRVIVLDLDKVTTLDDNAAGEVVAAAVRARSQGRRMILAGLTPAQYAQVRDAGLGGGVSGGLDACSDLELAVARALNLAAEPR